MVLHSAINIPFTENITPLNERYTKELLELVNLVQPGYFKAETVQLGKYFGIFKEIKGEPTLVAVTGERMRMNDYTEVSAVVTHPEHGGRGYAKQLVAHVANQVIAEGKMPFLHVAESNLGAIKLYEKLGFKLRRKISFWNYTRR